MNIATSSIATILRTPLPLSRQPKDTRGHREQTMPSPWVQPKPELGPLPPPEWTVATNYFTNLARVPAPLPSWWTKQVGYHAGIETWTEPGRLPTPAPLSPSHANPPALSFHLTLAGWGHLTPKDDAPISTTPGKGVFVLDPAATPPELPETSPGWTVAHIEIHHPYLRTRLADLLGSNLTVVDLRPQDELAEKALRLVRGAIVKDFPDQFDAERALFDFVMAVERWARHSSVENQAEERLKNEVRAYVLARLPKAIEVSSLAAHYGMSRSHFSHLFHQRTGFTPANFATLVRIQRVESLLLETHEPLKAIADACGFANANHLCKVFRRFRHASPTEFRQNLRPPGVHQGTCSARNKPAEKFALPARLFPAHLVSESEQRTG